MEVWKKWEIEKWKNCKFWIFGKNGKLKNGKMENCGTVWKKWEIEKWKNGEFWYRMVPYGTLWYHKVP